MEIRKMFKSGIPQLTVLYKQFWNEYADFGLENMIVNKKSCKKGMGKLLLNQLEKIARSRDCTRIILATEANRTDAGASY